jgi:hypothetical protein
MSLAITSSSATICETRSHGDTIYLMTSIHEIKICLENNCIRKRN